MTTHRPTHEAYGELQQAYDFYNQELFGSKLPQCLITFQRKAGAFGYFSGDRWENANDEDQSDEIAMNPATFAQRSTEEILSTLVHEMVHLKQHHFGKPGRGRYHNREWARMMWAIGLAPSATGDPDGKETGDRVTHYIVEGDLFDLATQKLLRAGFELSWLDRAVGGRSGSQQPTKTREKYSCPKCGLNAWAKPGVSLRCNACDRVLKVA